MSDHATNATKPDADGARDRESTFSKKLTASLSIIGSLVGIATVICWLIGDAYSQMVLRSFSIAPQLLDRSVQTVALSGVQVLFGWLADGAWSCVVGMLFIIFLLIIVRVGGVLARPMQALISEATQLEWRKTWNNVRVPVPPLPTVGVALMLGLILMSLGSARAIGRAEALKTISMIRTADGNCTKGRCPTYVTAKSSISGILVTADKDRMFISTGHGIIPVQVAALQEVKAPATDELPDAFDNRVMPEPRPDADRPMPTMPNPHVHWAASNGSVGGSDAFVVPYPRGTGRQSTGLSRSLVCTGAIKNDRSRWKQPLGRASSKDGNVPNFRHSSPLRRPFDEASSYTNGCLKLRMAKRALRVALWILTAAICRSWIA